MKKNFLIIIFAFSITSSFGQNNQAMETKAFILGAIDEIYSKELAEYRVLNIYLPEGYNKLDTVKYPVIYLLDGSANEDFIHIVGVGKEGKNVKVFFDYLPDENHGTIMHEAVSNSFKLLYPVSTKD